MAPDPASQSYDGEKGLRPPLPPQPLRAASSHPGAWGQAGPGRSLQNRLLLQKSHNKRVGLEGPGEGASKAGVDPTLPALETGPLRASARLGRRKQAPRQLRHPGPRPPASPQLARASPCTGRPAASEPDARGARACTGGPAGSPSSNAARSHLSATTRPFLPARWEPPPPGGLPRLRCASCRGTVLVPLAGSGRRAPVFRHRAPLSHRDGVPGAGASGQASALCP